MSATTKNVELSVAYDEFATEVLKLYNEVSNYRESISVLLYTDAELNELLKRHPNEVYIVKAIMLVHKTLLNLQHELIHAIPPAKPIRYMVHYRWTDNVVDLVELVYALVESRSIEYGNVDIKQFAIYLGEILGVDTQNCHDAYTSTIKRRKSDSRTHFLDKLAYVLNKKINLEDGLDAPKRPDNIPQTLFD